MFASISPGRCALLGLACALLQPMGALALSMDDVVPLFFDGPGGFGSSAATAAAAGESARYSATPADQWIDAGADSSLPVTIQQTLTTVHQNPSTPSATDAIIADSIWRIENQSAGDLIAPLLVFTSVDPAGVYPAAIPLVGVDGNLVDLVEYSFDGVDYLFGAIELGGLAPGSFVDITVRYIVGGPLAGGSQGTLPPLGVSVLGSYTVVPEPSTAALIALGLLGIGSVARRSPRGNA
jgi:hypothetical protein